VAIKHRSWRLVIIITARNANCAANASRETQPINLKIIPVRPTAPYIHIGQMEIIQSGAYKAGKVKKAGVLLVRRL